MPSLATSLGPSTWQAMPGRLASWRAAPASCVGVAWLAGRLAHSRASKTPWAVPSARSKSARTAATLGTPSVARLIAGAFFASDALLVVW